VAITPTTANAVTTAPRVYCDTILEVVGSLVMAFSLFLCGPKLSRAR
jgi:hypothetical protein